MIEAKKTAPARKAAAPETARSGVVALTRHPETPAARPATPKRRHRLIAASFLLAVVLPSLATVGYLYGVAADQYASRMAFSVRGADQPQPVEFLGALATGLGGAGAGIDAEIVYEFMRSRQMVEAALEALPLREIYNLPERDVVFRLGEDRTREETVDYWRRMTDVSFDASSGIVHFEARAFDAESAQAITQLALDESTRVVNALSMRAREDSVSVAREVLAEAEDRLRAVRRALRSFRDVEQEIDPSENARAALGLVSALETQLAQAQVERDTQIALVGQGAPRVAYLDRQIESLRDRIAAERTRLGAGDGQVGDARAYADLVAEFEDLSVDREFAENAYLSALASYERAQVEARRQMRYLAPHIRPTMADSPEYPQRALLSAATFAALLVAWSVMLLVVYNVRDRR